MTSKDFDELDRRRAFALELGGPARIDREHRLDRLTVRERFAAFLDPGTFNEIGTLATTPIPGPDGRTLSTMPSSFVCGFGQVDGRDVVVGGEDYTVQGGAVTVHLEKFKGAWTGYVEDLAFESQVPLVLLMQGGGGSVGAQTLKGYAYIVSAMQSTPIAELLGRVPVAVAVMGPAAGSGPARTVASHFSIMAEANGCMFAGGPPLVERALATKIDKFELGGVDVHVRAAGNVDNIGTTEADVFDQIRRFLSYLPSNVSVLPPASDPSEPDVAMEELDRIANGVAAGAYDVREVIAATVDGDSFFEVGAEFGQSLVTGLARLDGRSVGILANNAAVDEGAMSPLAADKQVRFVQLCNTFHLPIVYLVDTPGLAADALSEQTSVLRRGFRAMHAIHRATVPVVTVIIGQCAGLAGMATSSPNRLAFRLAWPTARFTDEDGRGDLEADTSLWPTVESFGVEEAIAPRETRRSLAAALRLWSHAAQAGPKAGQQFRP